MSQNRRDFLKRTGWFASAIAFGSLASACNNNGTGSEKTADTSATAGSTPAYEPQPLGDFGLQLYTLRDDLPKDPRGILKQVAAMGYKQVEGYEGDKGLWWGISEFKNYLTDLGIVMISSHCDTGKDFEKKAAEAAANGLQYLISPWVGPQKTLDDYKKIAENFNKLGETCKKNGIRFAYHNHDYSFKALDGKIPQEILMDNTDPALVDFEMDMYWVVTGGHDPETWLKNYKDRFRLCHVKDRSKTAKPEEGDASVDLGTGSIDYSKILRAARENGMKYYIVEQEKYEGSTPLQSAAVDAAYLKNIKI